MKHLHRFLPVAVVLLWCVAALAQEAKIHFHTGRDGTSNPNVEVYVMKDDGTAQTNRTNDSGSDLLPSVCPDGDTVVFASARDTEFPDDDKLTDIFVMNADGTGQTNLINDDLTSDTMPDCGDPSGTQVIVFSSAGNDEPYQIWRIETDGSDLTQVTDSDDSEVDPTWCGNKIVFASNRDGNYELYKMTEWGGSQTRLTTTNEDERDPSCKSDGSTIAFTRDGDIFTILINGSSEDVLIDHAAEDTQPTWSPGGTHIAFVSDRDHAYGEIYKQAVSGGSATRLTNNDDLDDAPEWAEMSDLDP